MSIDEKRQMEEHMHRNAFPAYLQVTYFGTNADSNEDNDDEKQNRMTYEQPFVDEKKDDACEL